MPPYIIFSDKTLIDMCVKMPTDKDGMMNVSGVGDTKYEKYGQRFLDAINSFRVEHPDAVTSIHDETESDVVVEKVKTKKNSYDILLYSTEIQKLVVDYYIGPKPTDILTNI